MLVATVLLAAATAAPSPAPEASTLGAHAAAWANAQGAGAVVTAERIDGTWRFALGGRPFAEGHAVVAPERIVFEIGSISKVFTGILLAKATREGKLALTDTLAARLPVTFDAPEVAGITLRQLATHTSCLPRLPDNLGTAQASDPYAAYDDGALFSYLAHARVPKAPPCDADYSNLGFGILGVVLERAYGKPWEALVREKITGPLGMSDTAQSLSAEQQGRFAVPWDGAKPAQPWTFRSMAGAGALRSTAADMAKLADALLAGPGGPLGDVWALLAADAVNAGGLGGRIGLALIEQKVDGETGYGHDGGTGGYRSEIFVVPKSGRAHVILASNAAATPPAWLAAVRAESHPPAERKEIALPGAALDDYVGVYAISPQARFTIVKVNDALRARLTGQPFVPLFASAKDEFFYRIVDAQISFRRGDDGRIAGLTLHQNGRDLPAQRTADPAPHVEFPSAAELGELAGTYDFGAYQPGATITVAVRGDVLGVQLTGQPVLPVFATGKDRFVYDVVEAALTFERDPSGKVAAVVLRQNGADMRAPRR